MSVWVLLGNLSSRASHGKRVCSLRWSIQIASSRSKMSGMRQPRAMAHSVRAGPMMAASRWTITAS